MKRNYFLPENKESRYKVIDIFVPIVRKITELKIIERFKRPKFKKKIFEASIKKPAARCI